MLLAIAIVALAVHGFYNSRLVAISSITVPPPSQSSPPVLPTASVASTSIDLGGAPTAPSTADMQLVITNLQGVATGSNFQQMISFNSSAYSAYEAPDLGNIRFYQGSTYLYSWCESGCSQSSSNAVFWISLPSGIDANSKVMVDMHFGPTSSDYDGAYAGEAPQLSGTYAQYDNGAKVFPAFYQNFAAGTSSCSPNCIIANGLTVNLPGPGWVQAYQSYNISQNSPLIVESYVKVAASTVTWDLIATPNPPTCSGICAFIPFLYEINLNGLAAPEDGWSAPFSIAASSGSYHVFTLMIDTSTGAMIGQYDYNSLTQASHPFGTATRSFGGIQLFASAGYYGQPNQNNALDSYWLRTRSVPPNDVMPTVSFGSLTASTTVSTTSSTSTSTATSSSTTTTSTSTTSSTSTSTTSVTTTIPTSQLYYTRVTLSNKQGSSTGSNFQQMISFNSSAYSAYESPDLGNMRFYISNAPVVQANELYSWCESGCSASSTNAIFWVKLPSGIASNANAVINMTFQPTSVPAGAEYDGVYAGEAPQLSVSGYKTLHRINYAISGATSTGSTIAVMTPGVNGANLWVCGIGEGQPYSVMTPSYSLDVWDADVNIMYPSAAIGRQSSNNCQSGDYSGGTPGPWAGVAIGLNANGISYSVASTATCGSLTPNYEPLCNSLPLSFNVIGPSPLFTVMVVACGRHAGCTVSGVPSGCISNTQTSDGGESAAIYVCGSLSPGSYTITSNGNSGTPTDMAMAAYTFQNMTSVNYAQYDNGGKVFTNYWNFSKNALPSGFSSLSTGSGSYTVNNGISIISSSGTEHVYTTSKYSVNIVEALVAGQGSPLLAYETSGIASGGDNGFHTGVDAQWNLGGSSIRADSNGAGTNVGSGLGINAPLLTTLAWVAGPKASLYTNYTTLISPVTTASSLGSAEIDIGSMAASAPTVFQYLRTRIYPPSGAMPTVSFGPVSSSAGKTTFVESGLPSGATFNVIYNSVANGITVGSSGNSIIFKTATQGTYPFSVSSSAYNGLSYSPIPAGGTASTGAYVTVGFTSNQAYTSFSETGLPNGAAFNVIYDFVSNSITVGSASKTVIFKTAQGSYPFTVSSSVYNGIMYLPVANGILVSNGVLTAGSAQSVAFGANQLTSLPTSIQGPGAGFTLPSATVLSRINSYLLPNTTKSGYLMSNFSIVSIYGYPGIESVVLDCDTSPSSTYPCLMEFDFNSTGSVTDVIYTT